MITIVVLLILVGISISALTQTGLFSRAKQAEQKSKEAEQNQTTTLGTYENGIYDFSGGSWERTSSIVNNGNGNLTLYGKDVLEDLNNGKSIKYITVYAHDSSKDNTLI